MKQIDIVIGNLRKTVEELERIKRKYHDYEITVEEEMYPDSLPDRVCKANVIVIHNKDEKTAKVIL